MSRSCKKVFMSIGNFPRRKLPGPLRQPVRHALKFNSLEFNEHQAQAMVGVHGLPVSPRGPSQVSRTPSKRNPFFYKKQMERQMKKTHIMTATSAAALILFAVIGSNLATLIGSRQDIVMTDGKKPQ